MVVRKTLDEVEKIRAAGRVVRAALNAMGQAIVPGRSTTYDLENAAIAVIEAAGATSAFLGYAPQGHPAYPAWTCISVNSEVVHGIPGRRVLNEGDVVSCDVGVKLNGYYGDAATTFAVGRVSDGADRLLKATQEALYKGLDKAVAGNRIGDVSAAIDKHVRAHGFSVVRDLVGHGVGKSLHEPPQIPNFGRSGQGVLLQEGMTLAIEPMVNAGGHRVHALADHWTVVTSDGKLSAHFEHTVAVTRGAVRILTEGD